MPQHIPRSAVSALFLSTDSFNPLPPGSLGPKGQVPGQFLEGLQNVEEIRDLYFSSIHRWLPMISKARLTQASNDPQLKYDGTTVLLLTCMKLVTTTPHRNKAFELPLYQLAKQFYFCVETAGSICIPLLQSSVLIAVYEFSQGLYPAAYLTIAQAARHGTMMGLHYRGKAARMFHEAETWTQREEERRTWWAVLLVDRYLHAGTYGFPIITCDPVKENFLPCDDASWDTGLLGLNESFLSSTPSRSLKGGQFGTLCRTCHIFGRVVRHKYDDILEIPDKLNEAIQLNRAIIALESTFEDPTTGCEFKDCDVCRALCYSARMILYNMYAYNQRYNGTDIQKASIEGMATIGLSVARMAGRVQEAVMTNIGAVSPLICHCLYQAAGRCARSLRENCQSGMKMALTTIIDTFSMLRDRWRICDDYLKLLEVEDGIMVES
ncbi:hypothetical protein A1O1_03289 [Capronia coronata CBS 617.96]|uniref:Xylanolytic transcriptional activator regulatory domain-containing protein n=1 Tax=Capronia coronata CBS 617.96 TaxID=1182541 RepID=W9YKH2_9EURO|nr:uncharacterized protein A1O1_03289 [Capronia coronata CBS 617.96]EXJ90190.1 hypothetical protein A1O1_03289 [Capronia coronata CBS 617.96]